MYRARIGDGRARDWGKVEFVPRPLVTIYGAWVSLPDYVLRQEDGTRFEIEQSNGDLKGYDGSIGRVRIHVQKEIRDAKLTLYTRAPDGFTEIPVGAPIEPSATGVEETVEKERRQRGKNHPLYRGLCP